MQISLELTVPDDDQNKRLDQVVATLGADYSRAQWQEWIKTGQVKINGQIITKTRHKVTGGDQISLNAIVAKRQENWHAQPIPIDVRFEDEHVLVINKPVGLVVHPGAGTPDSTLANALRHHDASLEHMPRAGIIHRLDKDTSGLLIIAKTLEAHHQLTQQLAAREIKRDYQAIVHGTFISGGTIDTGIDRHPTHRIKMAVRQNGRDAVTHYRLIHKFNHFTHIHCQLETGRTHQIRVHMAHVGHPIVGDKLYGYGNNIPGKMSDATRQLARAFPRQALHAWRLAFEHPHTGELVTVEAPLPQDMADLLDELTTEDAANDA